MPNVKGLFDAPTLYARMGKGAKRSYGLHATLTREDDVLTLTAATDGRFLCKVTFDPTGGKPRATARLASIDKVTAAPVNAFLKPYGTVKVYWRTGEYRWHPATGTASAPVAKPVTPVAAPEAPVKDTVSIVITDTFAPRGAGVKTVESVPVIEAETIAAPVAVHAATPGVLATERVYSGRKPLEIKTVTRTFSRIGAVLLPTKHVRTLESAWTRRAAGRPGGVLITGPAGTAKTALAEQFAFAKGVPFIKIDGGSIQTAADWYGEMKPNDVAGEAPFKWVWTDFALALMRGTPCVILVDEINRAETDKALNGLMGLLDWTATVMPTGAPEPVHLPAGILIIGTLNEGIEYVGTANVDAAVRDRFALGGVRMDYTTEAIEARILTSQAPGLPADIAKRLVRVASGQRAKRDDMALFPSGTTMSPRMLLNVAHDIVDTGAEPVEALWSAIDAKFQPEDYPALSVLIEGQFGAMAPAIDPTVPDDADLERLLTESEGGW